MIYFDHNATTPLLPAAREAWLEASEMFVGNPSSPHRLGTRAEAALDDAREKLARNEAADRDPKRCDVKPGRAVLENVARQLSCEAGEEEDRTNGRIRKLVHVLELGVILRRDVTPDRKLIPTSKDERQQERPGNQERAGNLEPHSDHEKQSWMGRLDHVTRAQLAPACPMRPARAAGRLRSFSAILAPVADDEHAQLFVDREPALGAGLDVNGGAFGNRHRFTLDLEHARAFENDVHSVAVIRLLAVGLGSDEHVDAKLEARRLVDDLVAAAGGYEAVLRARDCERVQCERP